MDQPRSTHGNGDDPPKGMKLTTIRISQEGWAAIQAEAEQLGISGAEFIREATFFRLGYRWAARMDDDELVERLRAIDRRMVDEY